MAAWPSRGSTRSDCRQQGGDAGVAPIMEPSLQRLRGDKVEKKVEQRLEEATVDGRRRGGGESHRRAQATRLGFRERARLGALGDESAPWRRRRGERRSAGEQRRRSRPAVAGTVGDGGASPGGDRERGEREREVVRSVDRTEPVLTWFNQAKGVFGSFHNPNLK